MALNCLTLQITHMDVDRFVAKLRARIEADQTLTPAGLARKAGMDNSTIRKLLSGENKSPRIETAERICKALGTTLTAFMSDSDDPVKARILRLYEELTPQERAMLEAAAKGLVSAHRVED